MCKVKESPVCLSDETRKAIEAAMNKKGITQVALADRLGVSQSYICNILAGRQTISMKMADKIVSAIGCKIRVRLVNDE